MQRITSFSVDHDYIVPGMYISRGDGDITTYDLRTRKPNCGDYMDNITMHSMEHMLATFLRNSDAAEDVIYFGPMGCRTGFYLILFGEYASAQIIDLLKGMCQFIVDFEGEIPGARPEECGNWHDSDLNMAHYHAKRWLENTLNVIDDAHMTYPTF